MASHIARSLALLILVETACCFYADVGVRGLRSIQPGAAKAIRATSKPVVAKSMIAAGSSSVATAGPALADADEELRHLVDGDRARRQLRHRSFHFGLIMFIAASAATGDPSFLADVATALILAKTAHRVIVVDGMYQDGTELANRGLPSSAFRISESKGAGQGLFATVAIPKGTFLMYYDGERIDEFEAVRRYADDPNADAAGYIMRVTDDEYIDAADPEACKFGREGQPGFLARYMNHDKGVPNVKKFVARRPDGFVSFYAARNIAAGEELRYFYSAQYWKAKGVTPV